MWQKALGFEVEKNGKESESPDSSISILLWFMVFQDVEGVGCEGNMLLNRLCESHIYVVPRICPYQTHLKPRMECLAKHIK